MIYTSADVRKVGKDGWIRETVDLSPFTSRTAGERSSPLYLDEVELKYSRWFASGYRQNLREAAAHRWRMIRTGRRSSERGPELWGV